MKQELASLIDRLAVISELANRENDEIEALYGLGSITSMADHAEIYENEPFPAELALTAFLLGLPQVVLHSIHTLMMAGREEDDAIDAVDYYCSPGVSSAGAVASIREKRDRIEYVAKGIEALGRDRLPDLLAQVRKRLGKLAMEDDRPSAVARPFRGD